MSAGTEPRRRGRPRKPEPTNERLRKALAEKSEAVRLMDGDREALETARNTNVAKIAALDEQRTKLVSERDAITSAIRMHDMQRAAAVEERNALVRQALAEGWSHNQVAETAGHGRSWVWAVTASPSA